MTVANLGITHGQRRANIQNRLKNAPVGFIGMIVTPKAIVKRTIVNLTEKVTILLRLLTDWFPMTE